MNYFRESRLIKYSDNQEGILGSLEVRFARVKNWMLPGLVMLGFVAISLFRIFGLRTPLVDDTFIFMRYARNLANGLGFVWNPGEMPVEGYTSFLYLMFLTVIEAIGLSQIIAVIWFGLCCSLLTLGLTWLLAQRVNPGHDFENLLIISLIGLSPSFLFWATAGMEVPLYSAFLVASVLSYVTFRYGKSPAWLVGFLYALTTLIRPEALIFFVMTGMLELICLLRKKKIIDQRILVMGTTFFFIYTPYFIWRWYHFGYLFPNTYYAKTGGGVVQIHGGFEYLLTSINHLFGGTTIILASTLLFVKWPYSWERIYLGVIVVTIWVVTILNGGDHFQFDRFLVPTLPFFFLLMGIGLSNLFNQYLNIKQIQLPIIAVLLFLAVSNWNNIEPNLYKQIIKGYYNFREGKIPTIPLADQTKPLYSPDWVDGFILMGQTLSEFTSSDDTIAVVPIGAIGYHSNRYVIDMVGIVDPVIAHQPFDPAYSTSWRPGHDKGDGFYILERQPDYIQLNDKLTSQPLSEPSDWMMQYKSVVELWSSPEFHLLYEFYPVRVEGGWYYNLYRRISDR